MTLPACADCSRVVPLRSRTEAGMICSACYRRRHAGNCGVCGEHRPFVGRDQDGRRWCQACALHDKTCRVDAGHRQAIVQAVAAVDPLLSDERLHAVLAETVTSRKALRWLANHLHEQPEVFTVGPTSTLPVLDRFTRALVSAGAHGIAVIDPSCAGCERRVRPREREGDRWLCSACSARRRAVPCAGCGVTRPPSRRDADGRPRCSWCVQQQRDAEDLAGWASEIVEAVRSAKPRLRIEQIRAVIARVAPKRGQREELAEQLRVAALDVIPTPFLVAKLLLALRSAGGSTLPAPACDGCRQRTPAPASLRGGRIACADCVDPCQGCGQRREGGRPFCSRCRRAQAPGRSRGRCPDCQRPDRLLHSDGLCDPCQERRQRRCTRCGEPAPKLDHTDGQPSCQSCMLRRVVDELLPPDRPGHLDALREPILAAEPFTARRWVSKTAQVLTDLHSGKLPISHKGLDGLPAGRDVEHLRALLIAAGLLENDPHRAVERLNAEMSSLLSGLHLHDQRALSSWLRWQVLPRLRNPADRLRDPTSAITQARSTVRQAIAFVDALDGEGPVLAQLQQRDIDDWFGTGSTAQQRARPFLAWAHQRGHLPKQLSLPPSYRSRSVGPADPEDRWQIARRLVNDDTLDASDRIAGALVVLYAQPLSRIAMLTLDDVDLDEQVVSLRLGQQNLELPEPLASVLREVPSHRRRRGIAEQLPTRWLFPGSRAGQHVTAATLARRLRAIGIEPRPARLAAITQLSAELPPTMLAGILGVTAGTAARWATQSGGNWTNYVADRP